MVSRNVINRLMAAHSARVILFGTDPTVGAGSAPNDLIVNNLQVREDASNGLIAYIYAVYGEAPYTYELTTDSSSVLDILNGNELHKAGAFGTDADQTFTIRVTDANGDQYSEQFTLDVLATETPPADDPGIDDEDPVVVPDPDDPESNDDGYTEPPVQVTTEIGLKISGKNGGVTTFLKSWGVPEAGATYTMKYSANWSGMSALGAYSAVGFGFKHGNNFHMVGLRGNGVASTTMLASQLYGDFRKAKDFTITNDGTAINGTKNGPNWLRLEVSGDGTQYTLYTSADGVTWDEEYVDADPDPLANVTTATQFGVAAYFAAEDKGVFQITIDEFWQLPVNTVAPAITGDPTVGETLSCDDGTWDGLNLTITKQWKADGVALSGETGDDLVLTEDEEGADIKCTVTATNPGGGASEDSNEVGPVEASGPAPVDGAHRYWRINITDWYNGVGALSELEFYRVANEAKISTAGGTPSASSTAFGSVADAFDGVLGGGNYWHPNGGSAAWLAMDFGSGNAKEVSAVAILDRQDAQQGPTAFDVQYSDDGSSWTTAWSVSGLAFSGSKKWSIDPDAGYRIWRLRFDNNSSGGGAVRISEFELKRTAGGADFTSESFYYTASATTAGSVANIFDNDTGTMWTANGACNIRVFMPHTDDVVEFTMTASTDGWHSQGPDNVYLDYSDDAGATWTNVYTNLSVGSWTSGQTKTFTV